MQSVPICVFPKITGAKPILSQSPFIRTPILNHYQSLKSPNPFRESRLWQTTEKNRKETNCTVQSGRLQRLSARLRWEELDGKTQTKDVNFYNLDAIISVDYRVNSHKATIRNFRIVQKTPLTFYANAESEKTSPKATPLQYQ